MNKVGYFISGLDCAEEINLLKKVLQKREGIESLEFDLLRSKMEVIYDNEKITSEDILSLIQTTGMRARLWSEESEKGSFWEKWTLFILTTSSLVFLIAASLCQLIWPHILVIPSFFPNTMALPLPAVLLYFAAIISGIIFVIPKAFHSLKRFRPDMNLLMVIAVIGAIAIHQWIEAALVSFLYSLALLLEKWSVSRARHSIFSLLSAAPPFARVLIDGKLVEKKVEEVAVGETLLIRPGEKIPLDALITHGSSSVTEAAITGESIPRLKEEGDEIYAGTVNEDGALECRVTKKADETILAEVIRRVETAQKKKGALEKWVDQFARIYTPIMILLSFFIAIISPLLFPLSYLEGIYRGLVILVIACPCALVISTPVTIVSGLTAAAKEGILIKGGVFLERLQKMKALALDKTGTLTLGRPEVQKIIPLSGHSERELLERAAALEAPSEHPIARAILKKADQEGISYTQAKNFQIIKGKGAEGEVFGRPFWIGSHRFMHEKGQETKEVHELALSLEDAGHCLLAIGNGNHICGLISLADEPRPLLKETLSAIKDAGIEKIIMLTGDNKQTAYAISKLAGIDHYEAELLPHEKAEKIEELMKKYGEVGMIGDGINDAPAMATASFGIAMGAMGTDAAIEAADIALMGDDLSKIPFLIRHSKKTMRIIKQNIFFSLGLKLIFTVLALFGLATLWMAIAADTGATLVVIFNGLRLLGARKKRASAV